MIPQNNARPAWWHRAPFILDDPTPLTKAGLIARLRPTVTDFVRAALVHSAPRQDDNYEVAPGGTALEAVLREQFPTY